MAFPNTVDSQAQTPDAPAQYGPFFNGSTSAAPRYLFDSKSDDGGVTFFLRAMLSADGGVTWTEQDSANRPQIIDHNGYRCCQSGASAYVFILDPNTFSDILTYRFDFGSNAWISGLASLSANGLFVCAVRTNSIVLIVTNQVTTQGVSHTIPAYATYDVAGDSFSAITPMDYLDYSGPMNWDMKSTGIAVGTDGRVYVASQQVTTAGNGQPSSFQFLNPGVDSFTVPDDCDGELIDVVVQGGGGGGSNAVGGPGGGAGGRIFRATLAVTIGDTFLIEPGSGGTGGSNGAETFMIGGPYFLDAGGGQAGTGTAGTGGSGDFTGGNGVFGTGGNGGNGGGLPSNSANGIDGAGGAGGTASPPTSGFPGPGGGGNAESLGHGGQGDDGFVTLSYFPVRGTDPGRLFVQCILADDSLGPLVQIAGVTFPLMTANNPEPTFPLSMTVVSGFIWLAVSGCNESNGYDQILSGRAANAASPSFTFSSYSTGNLGSGADPGLSLSSNLATSDVYLVYNQAPNPPVANLVYRLNGGAVNFVGSGSFSGCLISAGFLATLQIAMGTPTLAGNVYSIPT